MTASKFKVNDSFDHPSARRKVPRRPVHMQVGVLYKGQYKLCWAYEIGEGGALIDFPMALKKDDHVVISIRIPDVFMGVVMSKVVYVLNSKAPGVPVKYGLQFENIEFDLKRKMRNFVASSKVPIVY